MYNTGIESKCADAIPCIILIIPGPEVAKATPKPFSFTLEYASAAIEAPCSF